MKVQSIAFLGRQPSISLAELEAVLGAPKITGKNKQFAFLDIDHTMIPARRLGGTQKLVTVIGDSSSTNWKTLRKSIEEYLMDYSQNLDDGKLTLALSTYNLDLRPKDIEAGLLSIKKSLKQTGRSVRIITSKNNALSTAQSLHNGLARNNPHKIELNLVRLNQTVYLCRTTYVQDLDAYTKRDRERPARDAKVGMLPPKLAQILINLATRGKPNQTVLDPFCGTGVVLQEASLMGYSVYGTDLEPRMIEYSQTNLNRLIKSGILEHIDDDLEVGDATTHHWTTPFTAVAAETYLGKPLFKPASDAELKTIITDVDTLHRKFLEHLTNYLESGELVVLGVPAWARQNGRFKHLPTLDSLEKIGYNRLDFVHAENSELIYHRPGQAVAREILVLEVK